MPSSHGLSAIAHALGQPNFGIYAAGNAVSLVGTWMQRIAVGWLAWELTGSGAWLGIVAFADLCPSLVVGPIGGATADRRNPLRVIVFSHPSAMVMAFLPHLLPPPTPVDPHLSPAVVFLNAI